jgi:hypothetical protein
MNRTPAYMVGALMLIALGVVMLLMTLGVVHTGADIVFGILFIAGGLVFLAVFASSRRLNWWAIIPGLVLAAIGILILFGDSLGEWGGALIVGAIALAFLIIYLNNRAFWWAITPAGILASVALLTGVQGDSFVGLMFLGFALTFLAVYFVPTPAGRMRWAIWPAGVMLIIGVIISLETASVLNWVWAAALILGGIFLIYRAVTAPKS